jgi:hypothetical protein
MPEISTFYGIAIYMYYTDKMKHHRPHIHVKYSGHKAVFTIDDGEAIRGRLPISQNKLVQAWIEIHKGELLYDWNLAINKRKPQKIEPLK